MTGTLAEWHAEWKFVLGTSDKLADETKESYLKETARFARWHGEDQDVAAVTPDAIKEYSRYNRNDLELAASTRRMRLFCLLAFFRYVVNEDDSGLDLNPVDGIEFPIVKRQPPEVMPDDELAAILKTAAGSTFVARRDTAIIRMLLDTGARRGELCRVDLADLDTGHQQVTVLGKGGKIRLLPYSAKTALALQKYLRLRAQRPTGSDKALFVATRPRADGSWRLTGGGIWEMINRRAAKAGLPKTWPHKFRHTWAHDLLDNGASEQDVERLGGWEPGSPMVKWYGSSQADTRARRRARELSRGDRI